VRLKRCDQNIIETLKLVDKMVELAQQGDADREDVSCGVLYGVMLDSAFKIKKLAEEEKESHIKKGWWKQA
jgi:hypothetical protein